MSQVHAIAVPEFDPDLIARYDTAGPRYTSYPTAPHFRGDFGERELRAAIQASNEEPIPRPLSLYVHVPFCASPCFYCGCNRIITRDIAKADHYLERLYREIGLIAPLFDRDRPVRQLHFGGGTPNFLDLARLGELMASLARHFNFADPGAREFGIELDARFADADYVRGLAALGFDRISLGIQDFDPAVQAAVNRLQSLEETRVVVDTARASGIDSVSVDLIYGLPRQNVEGFSRTLDQVIALAPDRVAVYGYAHLPQLFKPQRRLDASELPDAATRLALFGRALERLTAAGYVYVGMDHFARADDELARAQRAGTLQRNFQGYSTHGDCDIVGLGVSAIGRIGDCYSQNARDLVGYYAALDAGRLPVVRGLQLDEDDLIRRALIGELMCHGELDMLDFGQRHRLVFADYFEPALTRLQRLAEDGLVTLDERSIRVTPRGRLLLRSIAMCFDAYLEQPSTPARYSRTI
ncbi:oxygen-independent coproporphyrinogen III oxidase [Aerosticca soli]|uniref:Coproporphyrinogen-III oxidase n=1 Tax=Aerosticca soli TaxID=2010829 RepID=A0A2Z6E475_9GAMM|nr:oxygen-independent coproporphyrinogen III oxidase [Aerosticca soli]MDI3262744.1 oxygen-independent coproporphyrinogen III oxidase [Fulvimonas sp.]BBD79368.1 coproporphyrinogen III oxidase, oxygen-independent [Aerosticca soli]